MEGNQVYMSGLSISQQRMSYCGQDCTRIPLTLARMYGDKVNCLDLSYNSIESLKGLEMFSRLEELVLDNNKLADNITLPHMPLLRTLSLNNNQINELEPLLKQIASKLPNLTYLSLLSNKACPHPLTDASHDFDDYQRYRLFVIYTVPSLMFLDSRRVSSAELHEAKTRGQFARVHRPRCTPAAPAPNVEGKRLPVNMAALGNHTGAYGKCVYTYRGKHSEGNRFIVNSDL